MKLTFVAGNDSNWKLLKHSNHENKLSSIVDKILLLIPFVIKSFFFCFPFFRLIKNKLKVPLFNFPKVRFFCVSEALKCIRIRATRRTKAFGKFACSLKGNYSAPSRHRLVRLKMGRELNRTKYEDTKAYEIC